MWNRNFKLLKEFVYLSNIKCFFTKTNFYQPCNSNVICATIWSKYHEKYILILTLRKSAEREICLPCVGRRLSTKVWINTTFARFPAMVTWTTKPWIRIQPLSKKARSTFDRKKRRNRSSKNKPDLTFLRYGPGLFPRVWSVFSWQKDLDVYM